METGNDIGTRKREARTHITNSYVNDFKWQKTGSLKINTIAQKVAWL